MRTGKRIGASRSVPAPELTCRFTLNAAPALSTWHCLLPIAQDNGRGSNPQVKSAVFDWLQAVLHQSSYLRLRFLPAAFLAALAVFFGDFFALFLLTFLVDDELLPPEKMVSQLSEYCFVAPMRTTLIVQLFSEFKK
jgi:hypothetical protein